MASSWDKVTVSSSEEFLESASHGYIYMEVAS